MIKHLTYPEIDFVKYEVCLANAKQKNVFAQKKVLDFLCEGWEVLVYNDYEYAMPLPLKRKLGQKFVVCPIFCQQLGVFGPQDKPEINAQFLNHTLNNFNTYLYSFNSHNTFKKELELKKNYFISAGPYELQRRRYSKGRKSSVKAAAHLTFRQMEFSADTLRFVRK